MTGTGTSSTLEAGQKLQVTATFQDAFLNAVVDAALLQGTTLELAYTGPVSGVVPLTVQQIGGLRCATFSTPGWCRRSCYRSAAPALGADRTRYVLQQLH